MVGVVPKGKRLEVVAGGFWLRTVPEEKRLDLVQEGRRELTVVVKENGL